MARKNARRTAPVEFHPEPEPNPNPKPNPDPAPEGTESLDFPVAPEGDGSTNPPRLEEIPAGSVEVPSVTPKPSIVSDGGSDVQAPESGSESVLEAPTATREGEGVDRPISEGEHSENLRILSVKGDTAPTQPSPSLTLDEIAPGAENTIPRFTVQRSMIGVFQVGAVIDQASLGVDKKRLETLVSNGFLLPV